MSFCVHFTKSNVQRTFYKVKCSAYILQSQMFSVHFTKSNVQHVKCYKYSAMVTKSQSNCLCKNAVPSAIALQKCIFAQAIFAQAIFALGTAFWHQAISATQRNAKERNLSYDT